MPAHSRLKDGVASLVYVAGIHVLMRVFRRDVLVGGFGAALAAALSHAKPQSGRDAGPSNQKLRRTL